MLQKGTILAGRYEILEHIGSGGMADVYKARCHKLNRYVAIKVLRREYCDNESFVRKFTVEAQSTAGLIHPNIVNIYDAGNEEGIHYIVMELAEGMTLKRYIRRYGRLSARETVDFAIQIASGLQAAHEHHIIHRDIKPQNILVSDSGTIKVTDFGIARAATGDDTISSSAMGSVRYLSPEQARGGYADERSDIYSLGITIYEMATGKFPFEGENTVAIALMQLLEEIGCRIKRGAHISILPPDGKRYIRLDSHGTEYTEASLRRALDGEHIHVPRVPRADYTDSQVKRLIDIESKLREGKGRGFVVWAERNNIDAKAQSVIYLKENHIHSYTELEERIHTLRSARNSINASIREKQNRMKEINQQRQAICDYRRTKDVYTKYRESGWSPKFYNAHRQEIEDHKNAQAVYAAMDGKMPSMKELAAEYDALRETMETEKTELDELKSQLTTLNHIKYNFDIITRDHLPEPTNLDRNQSTER